MNCESLVAALHRFLLPQLPSLPEDTLVLWEQLRPQLLQPHPSATLAWISQMQADGHCRSRDRFLSAKAQTLINPPSSSASLKFHDLLASANRS
jgi:hypothetical protein